MTSTNTDVFPLVPQNNFPHYPVLTDSVEIKTPNRFLTLNNAINAGTFAIGFLFKGSMFSSLIASVGFSSVHILKGLSFDKGKLIVTLGPGILKTYLAQVVRSLVFCMGSHLITNFCRDVSRLGLGKMHGTQVISGLILRNTSNIHQYVPVKMAIKHVCLALCGLLGIAYAV
jgi:hypothetical protein